FKTPFQQTEKTMPSPSDQAETDRFLVTEGSRSSSPCWCRLKFNRRRKRYVQSVRFSREQKGVHPGIPAGYPRPHARSSALPDHRPLRGRGESPSSPVRHQRPLDRSEERRVGKESGTLIGLNSENNATR